MHGLDSSSKGTKARYFQHHFPKMIIPDFTRDLDTRMQQLYAILAGKSDLVLIGSSFGGLMATIYAIENESKVEKLILLAPSLNFPEFTQYHDYQTSVPTTIYQGKHDDVTPLSEIEPAAQKMFNNLHFNIVDDDHLLRKTFNKIMWLDLLT